MAGKTVSFLFIILSPLLLRAQHYNYAPNTLNIPYFSKKNDVGLTLGWSRGNGFQGLELQGSYGIGRHVAVMANYFGAGEKRVRNRLERGADFRLWEAGIGAYEVLKKGTASLFAGYGEGSLFNYFGPMLEANFDLKRWFVQPGLTYRSEHFRAALAIRVSRISYRNGNVSFNIESQYLRPIQNIEQEAPLLLPEIGFQAGLVVRFITVNFGVVSIFPGTDSYNFARVGTTMSLMADLGALTAGKKAE
jgi:hypothetical protein